MSKKLAQKRRMRSIGQLKKRRMRKGKVGTMDIIL